MAKRKNIGKTLRFDIFKRDSFTCQYCGANPPNVVLEVDHIFPVSKGGSDEITNLITSCFDCNRGKRDNLLKDKSNPELVYPNFDKIKQLKEYNKYQKQLENELYESAWDIIKLMYNDSTNVRKDIFNSVKYFLRKLDFSEVSEAVEITRSKFSNINRYAFSYFCGVCHNKIRNNG